MRSGVFPTEALQHSAVVTCHSLLGVMYTLELYNLKWTVVGAVLGHFLDLDKCGNGRCVVVSDDHTLSHS